MQAFHDGLPPDVLEKTATWLQTHAHKIPHGVDSKFLADRMAEWVGFSTIHRMLRYTDFHNFPPHLRFFRLCVEIYLDYHVVSLWRCKSVMQRQDKL